MHRGWFYHSSTHCWNLVTANTGIKKTSTGPSSKVMEKKNVRREQRAHGLPYTDARGKMHAPRSLKPNPCIGKRCQNKCGLLWTEEARLQLFQMYWSLGHQQQRNFIVRHVRKDEVKRRRVVSHKLRHRIYVVCVILMSFLVNSISSIRSWKRTAMCETVCQKLMIRMMYRHLLASSLSVSSKRFELTWLIM